MPRCDATMRSLAAVEQIIGRTLTPGFCPKCGSKKARADIGKCGPCVAKDVAEAEKIYEEYVELAANRKSTDRPLTTQDKGV